MRNVGGTGHAHLSSFLLPGAGDVRAGDVRAGRGLIFRYLELG